MSTRGLYVFEHESKLGNAHAHALFDRLTAAQKAEVQVARGFDSFNVAFDGKALEIGASIQLESGVKLMRKA